MIGNLIATCYASVWFGGWRKRFRGGFSRGNGARRQKVIIFGLLAEVQHVPWMRLCKAMIFFVTITFGCSLACAGVELVGKCWEFGFNCEVSSSKWF